MEVAKPRIARLVIKKKPSMPQETNNIIGEIVPDKNNDCRKTNKRKQSDREEMWGWMLNSDQDQNPKEDSESKTVNDPEIDAMFDKVKRKKKVEETSTQEIGLLVEKVMALMEIAGEEDIDLNRQNKPAIKKIQMLPLLTDYLCKKHLQQEFLDHGVLNLFKNWLELLPDGSLPNATVRSSILNILTYVLPVDISSEDRREQLKKSGLGKVIMFLSKSDEEITANRKLAKDLIENWSRTIYNKSARFSDLRRNAEEDGEILLMKPSVVKKAASVKQSNIDQADLDLKVPSKASNHESARGSVSVPEPTSYVYAVNPQSNRNVEIARKRNTEARDDKCYERLEKKMRVLKRSNKKSLQATKLAYRFSAL